MDAYLLNSNEIVVIFVTSDPYPLNRLNQTSPRLLVFAPADPGRPRGQPPTLKVPPTHSFGMTRRRAKEISRLRRGYGGPRWAVDRGLIWPKNKKLEPKVVVFFVCSDPEPVVVTAPLTS